MKTESISKLHRLLERQLRKHGKLNETDPIWQEFIQTVNQAYLNFDEQNRQLERILELSGNELFKANAKLNSGKQELEKMVLERTKELREINRKLNEEIAERKAIEEELKKAVQKADDAIKSKSVFLSNMSHEIRTPMHAIVGLTELLLQDNLSQEVKEKLKSIKFSGDKLNVIIDDILDLSKIEAGKLKLEKVEFSLRQMLTNIEGTTGLLIKEKPVKILFETDPLLPEFIIGDPTRLHQILTNLVSNAVKFTAKGQVSVRSFLAQKLGKMAVIQFEIRDTGIGIAANRLESIFDSFEQAEKDTSRQFGGTGLGLTICKLLAELIGGKIEVSSIEGEGSCFTVSLPFECREVGQEMEAGLGHSGDDGDFRQLRVLLVEDNKINQFLAEQILLKWDIQTRVAQNGLEAIQILAEDYFDIVLMDLQMPEMDGFTATAELRSGRVSTKNPKVQIIALTADAFYDTKLKVFEIGMNDYLSKPFSQITLREKLNEAVKRMNQQKEE